MNLPYKQNVASKYGAPMGRYSDTLSNFEERKVHLRRVPLIDDCYDQGGAYWGMPSNLWCAWSEETDSEYVVTYFRADSRKDAKSQLPETCKFYR